MESGENSNESSAVELVDPVAPATRSAGVADDACPSCDAPGSWTLSKRHRFNPFGGVVAMVLSFWAAMGAVLFGLTWIPAMSLALGGIAVIAARRTALVCQVCDFVKPRGG